MNENLVTIIVAGLSGIVAILLFVLQRKNEQLKGIISSKNIANNVQGNILK